MRLKKSKQELLQQIDAIWPHGNFGNYSNSDMANMTPNQLKSNIEQYAKEVTRDAVRQAMHILLDNIYTQEEFEHDLNLAEDQTKKS